MSVGAIGNWVKCKKEERKCRCLEVNWMHKQSSFRQDKQNRALKKVFFFF